MSKLLRGQGEVWEKESYNPRRVPPQYIWKSIWPPLMVGRADISTISWKNRELWTVYSLMVAHSKSLIYSSTYRSFAVHIQWNPVNTVTNGPKKIGHINGVAVLTRVFFTRKCMEFLPGGQKKVAVITRWRYYRGGREAGFRCTMYLYLLTSFSLTDNSLVDGLIWRKTA